MNEQMRPIDLWTRAELDELAIPEFDSSFCLSAYRKPRLITPAMQSFLLNTDTDARVNLDAPTVEYREIL